MARARGGGEGGRGKGHQQRIRPTCPSCPAPAPPMPTTTQITGEAETRAGRQKQTGGARRSQTRSEPPPQPWLRGLRDHAGASTRPAEWAQHGLRESLTRQRTAREPDARGGAERDGTGAARLGRNPHGRGRAGAHHVAGEPPPSVNKLNQLDPLVCRVKLWAGAHHVAGEASRVEERQRLPPPPQPLLEPPPRPSPPAQLPHRPPPSLIRVGRPSTPRLAAPISRPHQPPLFHAPVSRPYFTTPSAAPVSRPHQPPLFHGVVAAWGGAVAVPAP